MYILLNHFVNGLTALEPVMVIMMSVCDKGLRSWHQRIQLCIQIVVPAVSMLSCTSKQFETILFPQDMIQDILYNLYWTIIHK